MPDCCLLELPLSIWNLIWKKGPWSWESLACFSVPGACWSSKFLGGLWSLHEGPCRNRSLTARRWLLTDGPIYIKGSYYAWNHSSIICLREFNLSIFQFLSDSGSDTNERSRVGFILSQCYFLLYLQKIYWKNITLTICENVLF